MDAGELRAEKLRHALRLCALWRGAQHQSSARADRFDLISNCGELPRPKDDSRRHRGVDEVFHRIIPFGAERGKALSALFTA
jgi:hypothetical protein